MLELILKELGIEIGEEWIGVDNSNNATKYKVEDNQIKYYCEYGKEWKEAWADEYMMLLKGEIKLVWKPNLYEWYYIPSIHFHTQFKYESRQYTGSEADKHYYRQRLMFKTKEEAIETANRMLGVIKQ